MDAAVPAAAPEDAAAVEDAAAADAVVLAAVPEDAAAVEDAAPATATYWPIRCSTRGGCGRGYGGAGAGASRPWSQNAASKKKFLPLLWIDLVADVEKMAKFRTRTGRASPEGSGSQQKGDRVEGSRGITFLLQEWAEYSAVV
jgi:hypothetical protein